MRNQEVITQEEVEKFCFFSNVWKSQNKWESCGMYLTSVSYNIGGS